MPIGQDGRIALQIDGRVAVDGMQQDDGIARAKLAAQGRFMARYGNIEFLDSKAWAASERIKPVVIVGKPVGITCMGDKDADRTFAHAA
ncbi:hypothetical protein [Pseudorhodoplanes sp.]|uniref:hypothetical protein n=1 Tax=Pseudorhodoplanes sp. TaxID=1934341 RepID=UPI003D0B3A09